MTQEHLVVALAAALIGVALERLRRALTSPRPPAAPRLDPSAERIVPPPLPDRPEDVESLDVWGFDDTRFAIEDGSVVLTGSRYELSGKPLPSLLPWVRQTMQIELPVDDLNPPSYPPAIPASQASEALLAALQRAIGEAHVSTDDEQRLRRGHGHTQEEMYAIKYGQLERIPDAVVFPGSDDDVEAIVALAREHGCCLIPYGGGTNVTDALRCPADETRTILSVDMRRLNRILWIDPVNRMAKIQAGMVGRDITAQLADYGLTMGHEPDSIEFSTLGGWVATHASGMKKNRYGNIEDLVVDVDIVTAAGHLGRYHLAPRESIGSDPRLTVLGSEGNLGIVTAAVVRLFPLPEVQEYGSVLFPDFQSGVDFLYELQQTSQPPASARLVDNMQFQFGQALKPAKSVTGKLISKLQKWYVVSLRGYQPDKMTACTLVYEGGAEEVARQQRDVARIAARHGGMPAGGENGKRGYQLTFGIAYIRDFVMNHWILAESFETSMPWTQVAELCERTKQRLYDEHAKLGLPGKPFVTCRVTQVYPTGACVYFYFAYYYKGVEDPPAVYHQLEHAARDEILRSGGSLSHHHGVGKIRRGFLPRIMSPAALAWRTRTKTAVDPDNLFGARNTGVGPGGFPADPAPDAAATTAPTDNTPPPQEPPLAGAASTGASEGAPR